MSFFSKLFLRNRQEKGTDYDQIPVTQDFELWKEETLRIGAEIKRRGNGRIRDPYWMLLVRYHRSTGHSPFEGDEKTFNIIKRLMVERRIVIQKYNA